MLPVGNPVFDPQTLGATAAVIVAVTGLLAELRRWRRGRDGNTTDPPGNL